MPIAYIYPDSTVANNNWTVPGVATLHAVLATTDYTNTSPDDNDDITTTTDGANFTVTLEDFSFSSNNVDSINSITVQLHHYNETKGNTSNYGVVIEEASSGTDYYSETSSTPSPSDWYQEIDLTARTTSDGSAAWTESDINGLQLIVTGNVSAGTLRLNYVRVAIDYDIPLPTYESGESMKVEEGTIIFDDGITII